MTPNYVDRFGEQLRNAALEPAPSSAAPAAGRFSRSRALLIGGLSVALLGGGTAAAFSVVSDGPNKPSDPALVAPRVIGQATPLSSTDLEAADRAREASEPVVDASAYFSVLTRPARASDLPPSGAPGADAVQDALRLAYDGPGGRVFVHATDREVCVDSYAGTGASHSSTCAPTAQARVEGVYGYAECFKDPPQRRVFSGVAPDGVAEVGAYRRGVLQASASVQANGFVLDTDQPVDALKIGDHTEPLTPVSC